MCSWKGKKGQGNGKGPYGVGLHVNERRRNRVVQGRLVREENNIMATWQQVSGGKGYGNHEEKRYLEEGNQIKGIMRIMK